MMTVDDTTINEIADIAVEKILAKMPEVIGNLMAHHAMLNKLNKEFYGKHPDFVNNKQLVAQVLESVEGADPSLSYQEILNKSAPVIQSKLAQADKMGLEVSDKPNLSFMESTRGGNGEF